MNIKSLTDGDELGEKQMEEGEILIVLARDNKSFSRVIRSCGFCIRMREKERFLLWLKEMI